MPKSRRPHLATALVMLFATAAFIWANAHERIRYTQPADGLSTWIWDKQWWYYCRGWPFDFSRREDVDDIFDIGRGPQFGYLNAAFNVFAALLILSTLYVLLERLARRQPAAQKRPRLQLHLSTAIVLMFAAGALMWMNSREHDVISVDQYGKQLFYESTHVNVQETEFNRLHFPDAPSGFRHSYFGWPSDAALSLVGIRIDDQKDIAYFGPATIRFDIPVIVLNFIIALIILTLVYFALEWHIRRHASRKQPCPVPLADTPNQCDPALHRSMFPTS